MKIESIEIDFNLKAKSIEIALENQSDRSRIIDLQRYFQTKSGQYADGDRFIGVRVPQCRSIAKEFSKLSINEIDHLMNSEIHEHRQVALFILVQRFLKANSKLKRNENIRKDLHEYYLMILKRGKVNNWDLIDSSAEHLLGKYLVDQSRDILFHLSSSSSIWERRASIVATLAFIKEKDSSTTFLLAQKLFNDQQPLIQKAVGWMLKEIGKRIDQALLISFLKHYSKQMPRLILRCAIENLSSQQKLQFQQRK